METDGSRGPGGRGSDRSIDRSSQPFKKPRLGPDDVNAVISKARAFPPRPGPSQPPAPRLRSPTERERARQRDSSVRGAGASSYQQTQELVAQYKTALAELTFNSKPIITNLTIIAGENLHAAKGIAATICANILEVPSDQKLPSLYLLDSIVKNIGRDYIKYFASRLPEVFCKAYKQVDSSIHPGMEHLFRTWKGVFLPATLQVIEKDLGFSSAVNGSSTGSVAARTDSQTQRPPHSIHVNPKYLEARHLFRQSKQEISSQEDNIVEQVERAEITSAGRMKQWTDPSAKNIHRPLRDLPKQSSPEKSPSLRYGENKFVSDHTRYSDLQTARSGQEVAEQAGLDAPWYDVSSRSPNVPINQRNKSDAYVQGSYVKSRSSQSVDQQLTSRNWKNSEEEEYTWDDMNSQSSGFRVDIDSAKSVWIPTDAKRHACRQKDDWVGTYWNKVDPSGQFDKTLAEERAPHYKKIKEQHLQSAAHYDSSLRTHKQDASDSLTMGGSWLGNQISSTRQYLPNLGPALGHTSVTSGFSSQVEGQVPLSSGLPANTSSSFEQVGIHAHEGLPTVAATSGIGSSSFSHSTPSLTSIQKPRCSVIHEYQQNQQSSLRNKDLAQILGKLSHISPPRCTSYSLSTIPSSLQQPYMLPNSQTCSQGSSNINTLPASSVDCFDLQKYAPFFQQSSSDRIPQQVEAQSQLSNETQRESSDLSAPMNSNDPEVESSGQSSASSLLAAIMSSGVFSNNPTRTLENFDIQPPLPSGPPPFQVISPSTPLEQSSLTSETTVITPFVNTSHLATSAGAVQPPLPPGPPPSSILASSTTNTVGPNGNPLSNLLNSLIAKGLISSSAEEPQTKSDVHMPYLLPSESMHLSTSDLASVPDSSGTPSFVSKPSLPESPQAKDVALAKKKTADVKDLIGLEFKPDIIRSFHPVVIDALFGNLKYQCVMCGLRFQLQEHLTEHIAWHDSRKLDSVTSNRTSRRWFANLSCCTASDMDIELVEQTDADPEICGPLVPADESQSICVFCGEPFEDFYCHTRDEWMYAGTAYMKLPVDKGNSASLDERERQGFIVHAKCMQRRDDHESKLQVK